uniref:Membrane-associated protein n=1 Tax=Caenorhabditis tropicalis TaxID=1561998 RepID=A0A1I7TNX7_9PELO
MKLRLLLILFANLVAAHPSVLSTDQPTLNLIRIVFFSITAISVSIFFYGLFLYYSKLFKASPVIIRRNWITEPEWEGRVDIPLEDFDFE